MGFDGAAALARLPAEARARLTALGTLAAGRRQEIHLVGGPVRDLLLGAAAVDLDVVVSGDGSGLAREAARILGAADLEIHDRFLTATLTFPDGATLDLATARHETYARPGALPTVSPAATVAEDLGRRDFTVNAMALDLAPGRVGTSLDPHGGAADLAAGVLRILHPGSFRDDPTRMLRLARFSARFGFEPDPGTREALAEAAAGGAVGTVSGERLRAELALALDEPEPGLPFARLEAWGVLASALPGARADPSFVVRAALVIRAARWVERGEGADPLIPVLLLLCGRAAAADLEAAAGRLALAPAARAALALAGRVPDLASTIERTGRPSELDRVLRALPLPVLLAVLAGVESEASRERLLDWLRRGRGLTPDLNGADLIAMGFAPGPALGAMLDALRLARLDGVVRTRGEEARWIEHAFRKPGGEPVS